MRPIKFVWYFILKNNFLTPKKIDILKLINIDAD